MGEKRVSEGAQRLHWRGLVVLAVVAAAGLSASIVVARTSLIHPDTTPGKASSCPPLLLQGTLTRRVPWADITTTASYDGRRDPDNRFAELRALYRGEPLFKLVGLVDDDDPSAFNAEKAAQGYGIKLCAADGYTWMVDSRTIAGRDDWIVANLRDGRPLPAWEGPYRFVGASFIGFRSGESVRRLVRIQLVPGRVKTQTPQ
jgi:hypothetical protein